jgi:nitrate/TMAO reductase-like tetraheme cytochrome c subunit
VLVLLGAGFMGVAEHRTSRPDFCASCHNMVPYYDSWSADIHGAKLDVACVDCHYAPGERTTFKAKFRGLSQVASYFSGRYGATRPRAHVNNESCLTSKCHGDLVFMDKVLQLGTVSFTHAKHLRRTTEQEQPAQARLAEVEATLRKLVGEARFAELDGVAKQAGPAEERYAALMTRCGQWGAALDRATVAEFSQLKHRGVRIEQLADLQCTSCHTYNSGDTASAKSAGQHHFRVSTTTCYTCHFNNEGFNTGTNRCLLCHAPPTQEITVHKELGSDASQKLKSPELAAKPIKMNHETILAQKVDCMACHADVAREDSTVTRRDCERCHDQARFFADWKEPFTVDLVARFHKQHTEQQRAKCLDCHTEIHHRLIPDSRDHPEHGLLSVVLANCTHCHPNHHTEQVKLLLGRGGVGVEKSEPNPMFGSRTNCYGCHAEQALGAAGGAVLKGTQATCIACHGERYGTTFEQWKAGIQLTLADAEEAYQNARKALDSNKTAAADARKKAQDLLAIAAGDLQLVKRGNGIHNATYSLELLESVTAHCQKATAALAGK